VSLGVPRRNRFPSVLLHPPALAIDPPVSYGEMSRRSGFAHLGGQPLGHLSVFVESTAYE
jgi:hypothetical protein